MFIIQTNAIIVVVLLANLVHLTHHEVQPFHVLCVRGRSQTVLTHRAVHICNPAALKEEFFFCLCAIWVCKFHKRASINTIRLWLAQADAPDASLHERMLAACGLLR